MGSKRFLLTASLLAQQYFAPAQPKIFDSSRLHNTFVFGLSNTFASLNVNDVSGTNVGKIKERQFTITPKASFFVTNSLSLGFKWQYGWYWSNFGRTVPNISEKSLFAEYYFTNWRLYKWNVVKLKNNRRFYMHPLINAGINLKNYYVGRDSTTKYMGQFLTAVTKTFLTNFW